MRVIINNVTYDNVIWNNNGFSMETDMSLSEIDEAFTPGVNTNIIVMDGAEEVARYYNKGLESVKVTNANSRVIEVTFNLTQIQENAETEIRESIDCSDGAIAELADIVADISEYDIPSLYQEIKQYFTSRMREEDQIFYDFEMRLRALEAIEHPVETEE